MIVRDCAERRRKIKADLKVKFSSHPREGWHEHQICIGENIILDMLCSHSCILEKTVVL